MTLSVTELLAVEYKTPIFKISVVVTRALASAS